MFIFRRYTFQLRHVFTDGSAATLDYPDHRFFRKVTAERAAQNAAVTQYRNWNAGPEQVLIVPLVVDLKATV